jgi:hypothetical protein
MKGNKDILEQNIETHIYHIHKNLNLEIVHVGIKFYDKLPNI